MPPSLVRASLALLLAAAPPLLAQGDPSDPLGAVGAAHRRLAEAVRTGDSAAVGALLADSARLRLPGRPVVTGRLAVVAALGAARRGTPVRVELRPSSAERCAAGVVEAGGQAVAVLAVAGRVRPDTVEGRYAALWEAAPGGGLRARELVLAGPVGPVPRVRCAGTQAASLGQRRFVATLVPVQAGAVWARVGRDFRAAASARGYGRGSLRVAGFSSAEESEVGLLAVRARLARGVYAEVVTPLSADELVVTANVARDEATTRESVRLAMRSWWQAALVGHAWRYARVAAGPALQRTSWSIAQTVTEPSDPRCCEPTGEAWSTRQVGVAVEGALQYPISSRVLFDARAQLRRFGAVETRRAGTFAPVSVDPSQRAVGVGLGVAF